MKTVILAKDLQQHLLPALQFLKRADILTLTGATFEELVTLHFEHQSHLIVTHTDLPGMPCESFVRVIRQSKVLRTVSILLLVDSEEQKDRALRCGANAVLSRVIHPQLLARKVQEFLNVPPRRSYRVIMNLSLESTRGSIVFPCTLENLSSTGMLISTPHQMAPGDHIHCRFPLPEGPPVDADGEVVRADSAAGSAPRRYGVHFLDLPSDAEARIAAFVDREVQRLRNSGALDPTHGA